MLLPEFKMNMVCHNHDTKELVLLTNGTEAPDGYFFPSEAIAIHLWYFTDKGKPVFGWTYIKVIPSGLTPSKVTAETFREAMAKTEGRF